MKITTISVTYGRKHNLGDYNSAHIEASIWADIEEGDDIAECEALLWTEAKEQVKAQLLPLVTKKEAQVKSVFAGLPVDVQNGLGGDNAN